ncbi:hypothetical protein SDC9_56430 [bioreactor metagenome]|uniref:Uncharacterized protein n=1 Tax=bioreactor metagenome TaxID=1076179 RepID=A0A644X1W5_9ZZZZ
MFRETGDELDQPHAGPGDDEGDGRQREGLVGAVGAHQLQIGAEGRPVEQGRHGEFAHHDGEGHEGAREDGDENIGQDHPGQDRAPARAERLCRLGQGGDVDGAQPGIDRAIHVGQRQGDIAEDQKQVGAEDRAGQRQHARGVVKPDIAEDDDDRRDDERQQGDELDIGAQPRHLQPHPEGGGHHDRHADGDGQQRHPHREAEGLAKARIGQHDAIGLEAVDPALHRQRELDHAEKRQDEIGHPEKQDRPGGSAFHFSHLSERMRRTI